MGDIRTQPGTQAGESQEENIAASGGERVRLPGRLSEISAQA